jgi:hypothetical protein
VPLREGAGDHAIVDHQRVGIENRLIDIAR